jgi:hypothetical protein
MSKKDKLDAVSEQMHGHTNWTYLSSLDQSERNEVLKEQDCVVVVFWKHPDYDADT